ncbi:hypothetical protein Q9966_002540 [Columba livia]|nr:hypothetical protein Q9966_002540 [Columba livia]
MWKMRCAWAAAAARRPWATVGSMCPAKAPSTETVLKKDIQSQQSTSGQGNVVTWIHSSCLHLIPSMSTTGPAPGEEQGFLSHPSSWDIHVLSTAQTSSKEELSYHPQQHVADSQLSGSASLPLHQRRAWSSPRLVHTLILVGSNSKTMPDTLYYLLSDDGRTLMPGQTVQSPICLWHTSLINLILFTNEEQYSTANRDNQTQDPVPVDLAQGKEIEYRAGCSHGEPEPGVALVQQNIIGASWYIWEAEDRSRQWGDVMPRGILSSDLVPKARKARMESLLQSIYDAKPRPESCMRCFSPGSLDAEDGPARLSSTFPDPEPSPALHYEPQGKSGLRSHSLGIFIGSSHD